MELNTADLQLIAYGNTASFNIYTDDGITTKYNTSLTEIKVADNKIDCDNNAIKCTLI